MSEKRPAAREDRAILILTYHSISKGPLPLCLPPRELQEQLRLLLGGGFEPVTLSRIVDDLEHSKRVSNRRLAVTFDDGYRDFLNAALPILESHRVPATLFVTTSEDRTGIRGGTGGALLALDQLAHLKQRGIEIGAHSIHHRDLTKLGDAALDRELSDCRRTLQDRTGTTVLHFAYPFGRYDARVRSAVGRHFSSACTTRLATLGEAEDRLALPRLDAYYLRSWLLRRLLIDGRQGPYLVVRRWLRRLRGTEPRFIGRD